MSLQAPIRTLLFSTLYPSSVRPGHGIFMETRLRELLGIGKVQTKVVAPVPWFFSKHLRFDGYAQLAQTPAMEIHNDVDVRHPRYLLPPKVGMTVAPFALALGAIPTVRRLMKEGFDFEVIDAHYYYPDGVAAAMLARHFRKPFTVTARGSDINLIATHAVPRKLMLWAAEHAVASIGVSNALVNTMAHMGIDRSKLMVMRNGVDLRRLVRMRNALLLDERYKAVDDWSPPAFPPDFKRESMPPYPEFARAVQQLGLISMDNDWERALAISKHLLGSSAVLLGGAIQSDLSQTYWRIVEKGDGYCGDFVDVFIGLANAAGKTTRPWAFSFDGFGGHGHIWVEIWNRQAQVWQLVGIYNNNYFSLEDGRPLSALEFRRILQERPMSLRTHRLYAAARPGYSIESKLWDYYRRGLPEWYQWRGTNVFEYDQSALVRQLGRVSRSLEQLGGIVAGVSPRLVVLLDANNRSAFDALVRLRWQLYFVMVAVFLGLFGALVCWVQQHRRRRTPSDD